MTVGLEQDGPRAVGEVVTGLVVEEGAVGDEDGGGNRAGEEGESPSSDDRLVQLIHRRLVLVIGGGVHVAIAHKEGVPESDAGREAHLQGSTNVPPGGYRDGVHINPAARICPSHPQTH